MRVVLFGPPGSGKGTQAASIVHELKIPHISSGDMFRHAVAKGTKVGKEAEQHLKNGSLVPDAVVIKMISERLSQADANDGFLLDGFPRTLNQAEALEKALVKVGHEIDAVVVLQVPDEEIIKRTTGRRIDPVTDEIYHIKFRPAPPEIVSRLIYRDDDREEIVRKRLNKYHADTRQVMPYYEKRGLIRRISGLGDLDVVKARIFEALEIAAPQ
jgi:adenylate kinase